MKARAAWGLLRRAEALFAGQRVFCSGRFRIVAADRVGLGGKRCSQEEGAQGKDRIGDVELAVIVGIAGLFTSKLTSSSEEQRVESKDRICQVEGAIRVAVTTGEGLLESLGLQLPRNLETTEM